MVRLTVALDITLNDALIQEGIARELVSRIQTLRKESGFEVTDRMRAAHPATTGMHASTRPSGRMRRTSWRKPWP